MRSLFLLACSVLIVGAPSVAQTVTLKGRVIDSHTRQPLPYASVGVVGTSLGTIANDNGVFKLALQRDRLPATLSVSYIGYASVKQPVSPGDGAITIALPPGDKTLREIVVMPDSSLRVLLKTAYRRIEQNYVTSPTSFTAFYREAMKTSRDEYSYFGEALLNGYVSGYQHSAEEGQFEILRSRIQRFPGHDTLRLVRFYASVFSFLRDDPVKLRARPVRPDFKRYTYRLAEMSEYDGRPVYVIDYRTNEKTDTTEAERSGRFYLDKTSLAFIAIEAESSPTLSVRDRFVYRQVGDKWHLHRFSYERDYDYTPAHRSLTLGLEGLITNVDTTHARPIPYDRRLAYGDVFSALNDDSTSTFWDGQTILEPSQPLLIRMQAAARTLPATTAQSGNDSTRVAQTSAESTLKRVVRVLNNGLETRLQVSTAPYYPAAESVRLAWPQGPGGPTYPAAMARPVWPLGLAVYGLGYSFGRRWLLSLTNAFDLQPNLTWQQTTLDGRYTILAKRRGNPLLIRPGIGYVSQHLYRDVTTLDNTPLTLDGIRLDSRRIGLGVGEQSRGLRYSVRFDYKLRGRRWLYATIGWIQPVRRQLRLYASEESGFFLFRGRASAPLTDLGATLLIDERVPLTQLPNFRPFAGEIGLRWSLR